MGLVVVVVLAVAGAGALVWWVGGERLRQHAELSLSELMARPLEAGYARTGLSFAPGALLALEIRGVTLSDREDGRVLVEADALGFGVRLWPLLRGDLILGNARLSNARLDLTTLRGGESGGLLADIVDERGLIVPDRLGEELFAAVHRVLDRVDAGHADRLDLVDVELLLPSRARTLVVAIEHARFASAEAGRATLTAELQVDGVALSLEAEAARSVPGAPLESLTARLGVDAPAVEGRRIFGADSGKLDLRLAGSEGDHGYERLDLDVVFREIAVAPARSEKALFNGRLAAHMDRGADKVEIDNFTIVSGRSAWVWNGAIGPMPAELQVDATPAYRFELVSDGSVVSPHGSPEPSIEVVARVAGTIDAEEGRLNAEEIGVRTGNGHVTGDATVTFVPGMPAGIDLSIQATGVTTAQAKQLWPWFAAPKARRWVSDNVFGGRVLTGEVHVSVAPGRLTPGAELHTDEVWGHFAVSGARFDVAGRLPPVRNAAGSVTFTGSDVDIRLETGVVYMASGRTVRVRDGSFVIPDARSPLLLGELEIDVAGEAAAILELAGYEPISARRFIDLDPDDMSGKVNGTIVADIPLRKSIDPESLDWMVMLDYADLSLARPFHGHQIADAVGSILVEPHQVVIDAEARLDGMQARVNLVEPLRGREAGRLQDVSLMMDDAARQRLMPGLSTILSGLAAVELRGEEAARREIGVDLGRSTLTIPWAGWSKGPGIPAMASFVMANDSGRTMLEKFALRGDTFSVDGQVTLEGGDLSAARFDKVSLNRGDDIAVDISRSGRGYRVGISGAAFDARALIKHMTADVTAAAEGVESLPVTIELSIARMTGFHGEQLRDVRLSYDGTGSRIDRLEFAAATASGQPVTFTLRTESGRRSIAMDSPDAGAVLRFLDIYERLEGGRIQVALSGVANGPMRGHVDARDFWIVNEPRLGSIVASTPQGGDRSLNQAVRGDIDVSRVFFNRGYAEIDKGEGYLVVGRGIVRGPTVGTSFRGTLYDTSGNMDISGTFMPAYGLNRLFGQVPVIGMILGNGRDGALLGITFRLSGKLGEPQLLVNPLSAIAPGIFRSVFEFN